MEQCVQPVRMDSTDPEHRPVQVRYSIAPVNELVQVRYSIALVDMNIFQVRYSIVPVDMNLSR